MTHAWGGDFQKPDWTPATSPGGVVVVDSSKVKCSETPPETESIWPCRVSMLSRTA